MPREDGLEHVCACSALSQVTTLPLVAWGSWQKLLCETSPPGRASYIHLAVLTVTFCMQRDISKAAEGSRNAASRYPNCLTVSLGCSRLPSGKYRNSRNACTISAVVSVIPAKEGPKKLVFVGPCAHAKFLEWHHTASSQARGGKRRKRYKHKENAPRLFHWAPAANGSGRLGQVPQQGSVVWRTPMSWRSWRERLPVSNLHVLHLVPPMGEHSTPEATGRGMRAGKSAAVMPVELAIG